MKKFPLLLIVLALLLAVPLVSAASVEFFPLQDLKVGMKGTGLTVVRGSNPESFDVEIIDVMPHEGFDGGALILAKFSGPVIEFSGGIAEGYSGSPVYIRGKLLGAVSSAIPYSDTHIGGITPIESMLSALPNRHRADYSGNTVVPEPRRKLQLYFLDSWEEAKEHNEQKTEAQPMAAVPLVAPLVARGLGAQSLEAIREKAVAYPFLDVVTEGSIVQPPLKPGLLFDAKGAETLRPGDAVGVSLMMGDIDLSAIGTVTYVDSIGQVLAFGHPFMGSGEINMPLQKCYVAYTQKSSYRPFKMGYTVAPVGTTTQDRPAAIGGLLGQVADTIPFKLTVNDVDNKRTREFNVSLVRDPDWTDLLVSLAAGEGLARTIDASRGGTIRIKFVLTADGLEEPIERTNYYYDDYFPTSILWEELLPLASLLTNNIYGEAKLKDISVTIDFTRNRVNASIEKAKLLLPGETDKPEPKDAAAAEEAAAPAANAAQAEVPTANGEGAPPEDGNEGNGSAEYRLQENVPPMPAMPPSEEAGPMPAKPKTVRPGDALRIKVTVRPYREEPVVQTIHFTLPEDFPVGPTSIIVHGGGMLLSIYNEFGGRGRSLFGGGSFVNVPREMRSLNQIMERALSTPLNNEVVITIMKPEVPPQNNSGESTEDEVPDLEFRVSLPTDWVIYDQQMIPIMVAAKDKGKDSAQQQALMMTEDEELAETVG
jgi:hypothetical protein